MECNYCGAETERAITTHTGKMDDCVIIIKNVECNKCVQCGSESYNEPEADLIFEISKKMTEIPLELAVTDAKKWKLMKS